MVPKHTSPQADLIERAGKLIPGVTLGIRSVPDDLLVVIERGAGSRITDANGKEYIDYLLASGPLLLGHAHPEIVSAVQKQAALGSTYYMMNRPAIDLAEMIVEAAPCADALRYLTSGSEATSSALRLARAFTQRSCILKFEGAFHGGQDIAQMTTGRMLGRNTSDTVPESAGLSECVADEVLIVPFNDITAVTEVVTRRGREIAAILVEPMQRILQPVPGFLEGLRRLSTEHGIVLIFDEIVSGFRFAWGGAQELYGVTPDLACYSKTIGGGYPISAVAGRREIMVLSDPTGRSPESHCHLGGTLNGNPISAAAGLACLKVLQRPGSYERLRELGNRLRSGLVDAAGRAGVTLQALGEGPMLSPIISENKNIRNAHDLASANKSMMMHWSREMHARGFMFTPAGKMYISLVHSDSDIEATLRAAYESYKAVAR